MCPEKAVNYRRGNGKAWKSAPGGGPGARFSGQAGATSEHPGFVGFGQNAHPTAAAHARNCRAGPGRAAAGSHVLAWPRRPA